MKKSEIKDLYNQSIEATNWLKVCVVSLPYARGNTAIYTAIEISARLCSIVKAICDYMIDDGSVDMTERLQEIKAEARKTESDVAKMGYSKERVTLCRNCRAIINNIKDAEEWTKPLHKAPEAPQQPNNDGWKNLLPVDRKENDKAIEAFEKAIENGLISPNGNNLKFNGTNALLAYWCGKIYCEDRNYQDPTTKETLIKRGSTLFPDKELSLLFGVCNLGQSRLQLYRPPKGHEIID